MQINLQQEVWEIANDPSNIQMVLQSIVDSLEKGGWQLSHLNIDGEEIYDNFADYISEHIATIQEIEVVTLNIVEVVQETILSAEQYIEKALPLINELADEFYQETENTSLAGLTNLLEGLQWIIQTMADIDSLQNLSTIVKNHEAWNEYVQVTGKLNNIVPQLGEAIENKDNILIGDMLLYEISPTFTAMLEKLECLVQAIVRDNESR